ncbi:glycosyltransferase family 2 protein [Lachnospiraceae bacterium OttesenSCG-928-E19]|nr:glycosyltransferase family 2 protein [Lachnospiraceae bacterium OttesenSCG-928-E19]
MTKRIAAITMARNDAFFVNRWVSYYGHELGEKNLYIYLDGEDQVIPDGVGDANVTKMPHRELSRTAGDKHRIGLLSDLAAKLFNEGYDIVIGCDCDEFLVADPDTGKSLAEYLSGIKNRKTVSGLGLDVGQDMNAEPTLDTSKPFLTQRQYAMLSTRYTKPVVLFNTKGKNCKKVRDLCANKPHDVRQSDAGVYNTSNRINKTSGDLDRNNNHVIRCNSYPRWGSGFHKVRGTNFHIDPNLYLLHFGMVDYQMLQNKALGRPASWKNHLDRQIDRTLGVITRSKRRDESNMKIARRMQTILRPPYAWNKPFMLGIKLVTTIPQRFKKTGI